MKLVIDIDERIVEDAKNGYRRLDEIADAVVKTGTPLPKGHGRLIDADEIMALAHEEGAYDYVSAKEIADAPTIIEADKEEEE